MAIASSNYENERRLLVITGAAVTEASLRGVDPLARALGVAITVLPAPREDFVGNIARVALERSVSFVMLLAVDEARIAAKDLAHQLNLPVFVVRSLPFPVGPVLVATSLSDDDLPAVQQGIALARRLGLGLRVAHCHPDAAVNSSSVEDVRRRLEAQVTELAGGIRAEVVVTTSISPVAAVVELLARGDASLLVLGSYPRSWLTGWLVPSVCEVALQHPSVNLLILPLGHQ